MRALATDIQDAYDRGVRPWGRFLAATTRKLDRRLGRLGIKYALRSRVKTMESLLAKRVHTLSSAEGQAIIKDLLGLRVTVPFQEDVESVVDVVGQAFTVHEIERKADKLSFREFAYDSVHVVVVDPRADLAYPPGCLVASCEIQVRTILQDAWAEVEHELVYKGGVEFPDEVLKKKLAALNASLTLSDIIFQEIRDRQHELRQWGSERFHELERKLAAVGIAELSLTMMSEAGVPPVTTNRDSNAQALGTALERALEAHGGKDYKRAIEHYGVVLRQHPPLMLRARVYNHRGMAEFMLANERAALSDFEEAVKCDPQYHEALNNCALVWRRFGYVGKSLDDFARSLAVEPNQPDVHFLRSQTFFEIGDLPAALEDALAALTLAPRHRDAARLKARIESGLTHRGARQR